MCLGKGGGHFLECGVRFGLHNFQKIIPVRGKFAELTGRAPCSLGIAMP